MAWNIDKAHTQVSFSVRHLGVSFIRGDMKVADASLAIDEANPEQSSIQATIDVSSLSTGEPGRDGHLKAGDFFDVETYPHITFVSKKVTSGTGRQARRRRRPHNQGRDARGPANRRTRRPGLRSGQQQAQDGLRPAGPDQAQRLGHQLERADVRRRLHALRQSDARDFSPGHRGVGIESARLTAPSVGLFRAASPGASSSKTTASSPSWT